MKQLDIIIAVYENGEYLDDVDIEVPMTEEQYEQLKSLASECDSNGIELSENVLKERLPQVHEHIESTAKAMLPSLVDLDDDVSIDDIEGYVSYLDDLCEQLL